MDRLGIIIDTKYNLNIKDLKAKLDYLSKNTDLKFNFKFDNAIYDKLTKSTEKFIQGSKIANTIITQTNEAIGHSVTTTQNLVEGTTDYEEVLRKVVIDQNKILKAENDTANAFAKNESRKRKEIEKTELSKAKASNKEQEAIWNAKLDEAYKMNNDYDLVSKETLDIQYKLSREAEKQLSLQRQKQLVLEQELATYKKQKMLDIDSSARKYGDIKGASANLDQYKNSLTSIVAVNGKLINSNTGAETSFKELNYQLKSINNSAANASSELQKFKKRNNTIFSALVYDFKKFSEYMIAGSVFMSAINFVKQMGQYTVEFNAAFTDLNKVVDLTISQKARMEQATIDIGRAVGQSSTEIMRGFAEFGRLTKESSEIMELTKTAAIASNVTTLTSAQSADALSTAMITFGIEAKNVGHILDSMNIIQNNFRVSAQDLTETISKIGPAAKISATGLEELEGISASIIQSTGVTGSESGTAIKRFISNLYKTDESDPESLSKTAKGLKEIMSISNVTADGSLKSFPDLLGEIKNGWDGLDQQQKLQIANLIGSQYHYSKFIALMENYQIATDATNLALNSQNSAIEENEVFLTSIQGRWQLLKVSFESLTTSVLNSGFLKFLIDSGTSTLNLVNNLGVLNVAISALAIKMALVSVSNGLPGFITTLAAKLVVATGASVGLATALSVLSVFVPAAAFIGAVVLIDKFTVSTNEAKNSIIKLQSEFKTAKADMNILDPLAEEFQALKEKTELTNEEQLRFKQVQNEIGEILPDMVLYYDDNGDAILNLNDSYKTLIKTQKEYIENVNKERAEAAKQGIASLSSSDFSRLDIKQANNNIKELNSQYDKGKITIDEYNKGIADNNITINTMTQRIQENDSVLKDFSKTVLSTYDAFNNLDDNQKNYVMRQIEMIDTTNMSIDEFRKFKDEIYGFIDITLDSGQELDKWAKYGEYLSKTYGEVTEASSSAEASLDYLRTAIMEFNDTGSVTEETLTEIVKMYNLSGKSIEQNRIAMEKLARGYGLSSDEIIVIQKALTNESIKQVKIRVQALQQELLALNKLIESASLTDSIGLEKRYDKIGLNIDSQLKYLDSLRQSLSALDEKSDTSSSTKSTSALDPYFKQLNELNELKNQQSILENKQELDKQDRSKEILTNLDLQQKKLHEVNELRRKDESILKSQISKMSAKEKLSEKGVKLQEELADITNDIATTSNEWLTIENEKTKLLSEQAELRKTEYKDQLDIIESIRSNVESLVKQELQDEIDAYSAIVDKQLEQLDNEEKLSNYAKSRGELTEEIAKLQNNLTSLSLDDSNETIAEKLTLEKQLKDKRKALTDLSNAYSKAEEKQALQDSKEAYTKSIQEKLNSASFIVEETNRRMTEMLSGSANTLYDELVTWNSVYGTGIDTDITGAWDKAIVSLQKYKSLLPGATVGDITNALSKGTESGFSIKELSTRAQMMSNSSQWKETQDPTVKKALHDANVNLAKEIGAIFDVATGRYKLRGAYLYANGGMVDSPTLGILGEQANDKDWIFNNGQLKQVLKESAKLAVARIFSNESSPKINNNSSVSSNNRFYITGTFDSKERVTDMTDSIENMMARKGLIVNNNN